MSEKWFYRVFGEEFGPVSIEDLRESAGNGTLSGDDEVRPEALTMWVPAKAVRELQDLYQDSIESSSTVTSTMNAAAATPEATDDWYYRIIDGDGAEVGPLTFDAIIELAKSGRLTSDDEVRLGVDSKWRRAGSMGRLVAVLPYQTRRRNPAPAPQPQTQADPLAQMLDALPEVVAEESLPEVVVEEPVIERKTSRPKPTASPEQSDEAPSDRAAPRPKSKRPGKKSAEPVAAEEPAPESDLAQEIEDQILEELMTPGPKAVQVGLPIPTTAPASRSPMESIPQDSWATTPHVSSPSSASSFSRPTPVPTTRPPAKSFKPVRSGPSLAERFQDPRFLKSIALLILLGLPVLWLSMPESNGADVARYRELDSLFTELRDTRAKSKDGKALIPLKEKFEQTANRISKDVKSTADADHPARQRIFWATSQAIPEMCKFGLSGEIDAEKQAVGQLENAAVLLGLKEPPKVDLAELSKHATDN